MKIAFFSPSWPPQFANNGIATYTDAITRALRMQGHECIVISPLIGDHHSDSDGIVCYEAKTREYHGVGALMQKLRYRFSEPFEYTLREYIIGVADALERAQLDGPIDILEIEESHGRSLQLRKWCNLPIVVRCHGPHFLVHQDKFSTDDQLRVRREGDAIMDADAVTCPSQNVLDAIHEHYEEIAPLHRTIANPVDLPSEDQCWHIDRCDPNLIVFVGRFDLVKGADIAIRAFSMLAKQRPNLRLKFIGRDVGIIEASGEHLQLQEFLDKYIDRDVQSRIEITGQLSYSEVMDARRGALLTIAASRYETFSYAASEALAYGCPFVSTPTSGHYSILKNECDAMYSSDFEPASLAQSIAKLLDDHQLTNRIATTGRKTAGSLFSSRKIADQTIRIYEEILASRRALTTQAVS